MADRMARYLLLIAQILTLWPIWHWLWSRLPTSADLAGTVMAVITALFFVWSQRGAKALPRPLLVPTLLLLIYAVAYHQLPALLQAALALLALSSLLSSLWLGCRLHLAMTGLLLLALPLIPSLQVLSWLSATPDGDRGNRCFFAVEPGGYVVIAQGNALVWGPATIFVDAPCSGVKMLWTSGYLLFTLGCLYDLPLKRLLVAAILALVAAFCGNVLRASALFYIERGGIPYFHLSHQGVGVSAFLLTALMTVATIQWLHHLGLTRKEP